MRGAQVGAGLDDISALVQGMTAEECPSGGIDGQLRRFGRIADGLPEEVAIAVEALRDATPGIEVAEDLDVAVGVDDDAAAGLVGRPSVGGDATSRGDE